MKKTIFSLIISIFLFIPGCDYLKDAENYKGRKETVDVQALDAVGYNGTAVRKSVDKVLDANDAKNSGIEKIMEK